MSSAITAKRLLLCFASRRIFVSLLKLSNQTEEQKAYRSVKPISDSCFRSLS